MKRLLFVCHGNICRSPMAEFVMKKLVRNAGREAEFQIASAATSDEETGNPIYPMARQELARHGVGCPGHVARRLTQADYAAHDMIIGMDAENMTAMLALFGADPDGKLSLLMDHTGHPHDVADPWYTRNFSRTWDDILGGCTALLNSLTDE